MFTRYITAAFAITALILASCSLAAPNYAPKWRHPGKLCRRDPAKRIGGPGWTPMWQGARGPLSWTSGRGGNNAKWDPTQNDFTLQSGDATKPTNHFYVKIINQGWERNYGFLVDKGEECLGHISSDAITKDSKFQLAVQTSP
jgi:hypothetical protein